MKKKKKKNTRCGQGVAEYVRHCFANVVYSRFNETHKGVDDENVEVTILFEKRNEIICYCKLTSTRQHQNQM